MGWFADNDPQQTERQQFSTGRGAGNRVPMGTPGAVGSDAAVIPGGTNTIAQQAQSGGGEDLQAWFQQLTGGKQPSLQMLESLKPQLAAKGITLEYNAAGNSADLKLPGGQYIDVMVGAGQPGGPSAWSWQPEGSGGAQQGQNGLPAGYSMTGANNLASFSAPGLAAPWTQQFQAPTGTDDPGFQFAMEQGQKGLERSAAARGTLLTGGTLKDLAGYTTGMALQGYGDAWNRAKNVYDTNRGTFWGNQDNAFTKLSGLSNQGADAASSYAANVGNMYQQGANANAAQTATQNQGWQNTFGNLADLGTGITQDYLNRRKAKTTLPNQPIMTGDATRGGAYA